MKNFKVLYTDTGLKDVSIERRVLETAGIQMTMASGIDEETLIREGAEYDGVMVEYAQITERVLKAWAEKGRVRCVVRQGIGVDNIDVEAATRLGIIVGNVPDYCIDEVADHTMALALCVWRDVKSFDRKIQRGIFEERASRPIYRLRGKKCCMYGFGNIARAIAIRMHAFGVETCTYDPYVTDEVCREYETSRVASLQELASLADIFTVHAPLNDSTWHTVNGNIFNHMKGDCILHFFVTAP